MKNVGIITFHCSYNYGSALQAYALQSYIEKLGYNVKIIDYVMKDDFEQYKIFRTNYYKKHIKSLIADIIFLIPHIKRRNGFRGFTAKHLNLTEKKYTDRENLTELNEDIDIFVCGSDQIWNLDCTKGAEPAYFLAFADEYKKKIAYAPSLAHTSFVYDSTDDVRRFLKDFDFISVREESTLPYMQNVTDKDVSVVLDPTLLLDTAEYEKILPQSGAEQKKYIFAYMLGYDKNLIDYCSRITAQTGYEFCFVSNKVNCGINGGRNLFGISPSEFLEYIKNAEYVVTNSFHATVFSILFNRKFVTFTTHKSSARITDLLKNLNLEDRLYKDGFEIENAIDYADAINRLRLMRRDSVEFLTTALKEEGLI